MSKTLVLYVFHEYNSRVDYFIKNAIFEDETVDWIIVCNNPALEFSVPSYVKILRRENRGYDFAAWSVGLFTDDIYKNYTNFIFCNSSIIGPYLHKDYDGKWTDVYLRGLNDQVKLFGSTINNHFFHDNVDVDDMSKPLYFSHVQSYIFCMDNVTLDYLIKCGIFSLTNNSDNFVETIVHKEIGMSRRIVQNNWNIGSLMSMYKDVDFRFVDKKPWDYHDVKFVGDVMFPEGENVYWTAKELVFIKGNRNADIDLPSK
jgi:hypothetical protein